MSGINTHDNKSAAPLNYKDFEDVSNILDLISKQSEDYWAQISFLSAQKVFNLMYDQLPAYRRFLKSKGCDLQLVNSLEDFQKVPVLTKKEYLHVAPYEELLLGKPEQVRSFYMSSGSTGEPTIWPRLPEADISYSVMVNFFYSVFWQINKRKTLYISAMDLGIWASGNLQFNAATYCASRNDFTFANPGANYKYIHSIIKQLHKYYDQIVIATYPSVARRLLDFLSEKDDLNLKELKVKFMLGGEPHTIEWRHHLLQEMGLSADTLDGVIDYYGTSDSGGPGSSTQLTELIQNLCLKDKKLCKSLFGQIVVPSLFQKNPFLHIESVGGQIVVTYPGQLPLCRYDSGDTGGVISFKQAMQILGERGYDVKSLLKEQGFDHCYIWEWPFIYLTGRSDYAVSVGGAVVYPKDIEGLFFHSKSKEIRSFKLSAEYDPENNPQFIIYLELKPKSKLSEEEIDSLSRKYSTMICERLIEVNDDYAGAYEMDKSTCVPCVKIVPFNTYPFLDEIQRHKPLFLKKD